MGKGNYLKVNETQWYLTLGHSNWTNCSLFYWFCSKNVNLFMVTVRCRSTLHVICFSRDVRRTGRPPPCSPHVNVDVAHPTPKPTHWGSLPAPKLVALVSDISIVYTKSCVLCTEIRNQRHGICSGKTSPLSHVTGLECGYQNFHHL